MHMLTSVRHPREHRYPVAASASRNGIALQLASMKEARYPATANGRVITLGAETWGRVGSEAEHILAVCSACAALRDHRRGRVASRARLRRWQAMLDAALQCAVAQQRVFATAGIGGRAPTRHSRPADLSALELSSWHQPLAGLPPSSQ